MTIKKTHLCPNGHESAYRLCLTCREAEILSRVELTKRKKIEVETRGRKKGCGPTAIYINETGKRYGRLQVKARATVVGVNRHAFWLCTCDCGGEKVVSGRSLRYGRCKSCGCLEKAARFQRRATRKVIRISLTEAEKARCKRIAEKMLAKVKL